MELRITTTGLDELRGRYARAPQIITDELTTSMTKVVLMGERESKQKAPKWRNQLTRSIHHKVTSTIGTVTGFWGTKLGYARFKEYGTRRHFVPWAYIGEWAEAHGFEAPKNPAKGGIVVSGKAQPFIQPAYELVKPKVGPEFRAAIRRALGRIRGGG